VYAVSTGAASTYAQGCAQGSCKGVRRRVAGEFPKLLNPGERGSYLYEQGSLPQTADGRRSVRSLPQTADGRRSARSFPQTADGRRSVRVYLPVAWLTTALAA
jgi:hypothetical protein